jgi:Fur family transcriptional regulator, peroxide stress response regulator
MSDDLKRNFQEKGLRMTPQRRAIYDALTGRKEHPSASELYERLKKDHPALSLDTVNRNLLDFWRAGLIQCAESLDCVKRFDGDLAPHHHFHCLECGGIVDFGSPDLDQIRLPGRLQKRFKIFSKKVHVTGICDGCLQTQKGRNKTVLSQNE